MSKEQPPLGAFFVWGPFLCPGELVSTVSVRRNLDEA